MNKEDALAALGQCRERIDEVDRRIIALLNERTNVVEEIGRIKGDAQMAVYEPRREDQVFANIADCNRGPLSHDAAKRIFERIIDEMRKIQRDKMENKSC
jgi:chorismate mutase-like protein